MFLQKINEYPIRFFAQKKKRNFVPDTVLKIKRNQRTFDLIFLLSTALYLYIDIQSS